MGPTPVTLGDLALHVGAHAAGTSSFDRRFVAASAGLVGGVGGLLSSYLGERGEPA